MRLLAIAPLIISLMTFALMTFAQASDKHAADTIFINGNIYTGAETSVNAKRPHAIAVASGRILAVGTDEEVRKFKDNHTRIVDLGGHFVMPGFNDAHLHLAAGGLEKLNVDLVGTHSLADMLSRIAAATKTTPAGEWIEGRGWDQTTWSDSRLPSRQDLDAVTGDHPAFFIRVDGHILVANTAALRVAGITRATANPAGGQIDRDAAGEPTGILREKAKDDLELKAPPPSPARRRRGIELALQDAAQWGLTSVQESPTFDNSNADWDNFLVYEDLEREGKLTLRISEWLPFRVDLRTLESHRARHPQTDPMLHTGMLKAYMDGSLGSRTAAMLAPYADDPGNKGLLQFDQPQLNQMADERVNARFQLGFHAIGDAGVRMALDAFAEAERYAREHNGSGARTEDFRFRVEHAQVVAPEDFKRFRDLKVIASMQPNHLLTDMNWALARLGPERANYSYAWKRFLDDGVVVAFGTDYPVEPLTPFRGLYAAVTRKNEAGTKEYFPEQKLTMQQAIAAYTTGPAYAEFAEKDKGVLAPGMLADFVVLDRDITAVAPPEILKTEVLRTVVGGNTVYESGRGSRSTVR